MFTKENLIEYLSKKLEYITERLNNPDSPNIQKHEVIHLIGLDGIVQLKGGFFSASVPYANTDNLFIDYREGDYLFSIFKKDNLYFYSLDQNYNKAQNFSKEKGVFRNEARKNPSIYKAIISKRRIKTIDELTAWSSLFKEIVKSKHLFTISNSIIKRIENNDFFNNKKDKTIIKELIKFHNQNNDLITNNFMVALENEDKESMLFFLNKIKTSISIINVIKNNSFEKIYDILEFKKNNYEFQKVLSKKLSKSHYDFINDEALDKIKSILSQNISANDFHEMYIRKSSKYKTKEAVNIELSIFLKNIGEWNSKIYKDLFSKYNVTYKEIDINVFIANIESYEQSSLLGTRNWCIVTSEPLYDSYTRGDKKQLFIFDFNKETTDNLSLVGVTLDPDNNYHYIQDRNDKAINEDCLKKEYLNCAKTIFPNLIDPLVEFIENTQKDVNLNRIDVSKLMITMNSEIMKIEKYKKISLNSNGQFMENFGYDDDDQEIDRLESLKFLNKEKGIENICLFLLKRNIVSFSEFRDIFKNNFSKLPSEVINYTLSVAIKSQEK